MSTHPGATGLDCFYQGCRGPILPFYFYPPFSSFIAGLVIAAPPPKLHTVASEYLDVGGK